MNFDGFLQKICPPLDLEWRKYRRRAARHRLDRRIRELGLSDYPSYLERLRTDPVEAKGLADLMRVTVSRFFRDRTCWTDLAVKALPEMLVEKAADTTLRVWSAGCCGGEEPYTMALVWLEYLRPLFPGCSIDILATDIDDSSLERASKARYASGSLREVPSDLLDRWFMRKNGMWLVDESVKAMVRFQRRNLMEDAPPSGLDLVLCRYLVFTYYRGDRLLKAAERLWGALRPGGLLMTGRSEALNGVGQDFFEPLPGTGCLYRKR